jgi:hypothetical protein
MYLQPLGNDAPTEESAGPVLTHTPCEELIQLLWPKLRHDDAAADTALRLSPHLSLSFSSICGVSTGCSPCL